VLIRKVLEAPQVVAVVAIVAVVVVVVEDVTLEGKLRIVLPGAIF